MDAKKKAKLIRTLTDALYELFTVEPEPQAATNTKFIEQTLNAFSASLRQGKPTRKAAAVPTKRTVNRGPAKGTKATPRPCPVTGVPNTFRRYSYLMPEVRTAANLKKYKGWAKRVAQAESTPVAKRVKATKAAKKQVQHSPLNGATPPATHPSI